MLSSKSRPRKLSNSSVQTFQPADGQGRKDCYHSFKAVAVAMGLLPSNSLIKELAEPARVKAYKQLTGNQLIYCLMALLAQYVTNQSIASNP